MKGEVRGGARELGAGSGRWLPLYHRSVSWLAMSGPCRTRRGSGEKRCAPGGWWLAFLPSFQLFALQANDVFLGVGAVLCPAGSEQPLETFDGFKTDKNKRSWSLL